ncbi:hypothetical protein C5E13_18985, partial [Pseudoclavibacter sp. RFBI4]
MNAFRGARDGGVAREEQVRDDVGHDLVEGALIRCNRVCQLARLAGLAGRAALGGVGGWFGAGFDDGFALLACSVTDGVRDERVHEYPQHAHAVAEVLDRDAAVLFRAFVALVDGLPGQLFRDALGRVLQRCRRERLPAHALQHDLDELSPPECLLGRVVVVDLQADLDELVHLRGRRSIALERNRERRELAQRHRRRREVSLGGAGGELHEQSDLVRDRSHVHGRFRAPLSDIEGVPEVVRGRVGSQLQGGAGREHRRGCFLHRE